MSPLLSWRARLEKKQSPGPSHLRPSENGFPGDRHTHCVRLVSFKKQPELICLVPNGCLIRMMGDRLREGTMSSYLSQRMTKCAMGKKISKELKKG